MKKILSFAVGALLSLTGIASADTYKIDTAHSAVSFSIAHLVISEVNGRFNEFEGELTVDPATKKLVTGGKGVIQAKSIDTGIKKRDEHLCSADFFEVDKFPTLSFTGTDGVVESGKTVFVGKFTMHGVTKDIRVPVTVKGPITDPWGKTRIAFVAKTSLNRKTKVDVNSIEIGVARREDVAEPTERTGKIDYFDSSKGFGFIKETNSQEKFFVHVKGLLQEVKEGDTVTFELERGLKGMNAVKVKKI